MKFPQKTLLALLAIGTLSAGVLAVSADDIMPGKGNFDPEQREQMREAVDNGDYEAWLEIAPEHMKEVITEDNFDQFVEAHNLMQEGDREGAEAIFDELGLERPRGNRGPRNGQNMQNMEAMREALDNSDYEAFLEVAPERLKELITEDNFDQFVEAHNLMQEGDREGAEAIFDELGLERPQGQGGCGRGNGHGRGRGQEIDE